MKNGDTLANFDWGNINHQIKEFIIDNTWKGHFLQEHICSEFVDENIRIDYFWQCDMYQKGNGIDFESEFGRIIKSIDYDMWQKRLDENTAISELPVCFLSEKCLYDFKLLEQEGNMRASEGIGLYITA